MSKRTLTASFQILFSLVGALDAGTLYWAHRMNADLPCTTGGGCDVVNSSPSAFLFGIPVSLLGAITYVVLLFASVLRLTTDSETTASRVNAFQLAVSLFGTCFSWYLQYIAAFRIGEFCIYCRVSAITMSLFFVTSLVALMLSRSAKSSQSPPTDQNAGWPQAQARTDLPSDTNL